MRFHKLFFFKLEELENSRNNLASFALLAAAFINFLAGNAEDKRKISISQWMSHVNPQKKENESSRIPAFSLKAFLTDEQELMQWRSEGLLSDNLTVENALAILKVLESSKSFDQHDLF